MMTKWSAQSDCSNSYHKSRKFSLLFLQEIKQTVPVNQPNEILESFVSSVHKWNLSWNQAKISQPFAKRRLMSVSVVCKSLPACEIKIVKVMEITGVISKTFEINWTTIFSLALNFKATFRLILAEKKCTLGNTPNVTVDYKLKSEGAAGLNILNL